MRTKQAQNQGHPAPKDHTELTGANRRTLEAIFRHPSAHNLEWAHVIALIKQIGEVEERANSEFAFHVSGHLHLMRKPHGKDLTGAEVVGLRKFLEQAGLPVESFSQSLDVPAPGAPSLVVVMDHHEAKVYRIDGSANDPSSQNIRPYDPHHFRGHLTHKNQDREQGQRAPEDPSFYKQIAQAIAPGGRIVVIGHGTGKSNAAHHLIEYLRAHEHTTYERLASEVVTDLSSTTTPQLLKLAQEVLL